VDRRLVPAAVDMAMATLRGLRRPAAARPGQVIPGYTGVVKTAISVPDETFEEATKQAAELGISRSELFTRAAAR
jgi:hypothetical protein